MYERQFIIAPDDYISHFEWEEMKLIDGLKLKNHYLLDLCKVRCNGQKIILIGYILDPSNPKLNNKDIIKNLLKVVYDIESLCVALEKLSGRFIIIYISNNDMYLVHDATGLRTVYYSFDNKGKFICSSQPGHIAKIQNLKYSNYAQKNFLDSSYYKKDKEYWIPSGITLYENIEHLVPNHFLDYNSHKQIRYWPRKKKVSNKPKDIVKKCVDIFSGSIKAANNRFDIAVAITAGYDSRMVLAATKDISDEIYYYTCIYGQLDSNSPDIKIPHHILSKLGINHNILDCSSKMDKKYNEYYKDNVDLAHECYGNIGFGLKSKFPKNMVDLRVVSEISRCFYYRKNKRSGYDLAKIVRMESSELAISTFQKWLDNSKKSITQNRYELLDIFYWEHRLGSWRAMAALEWDGIRELFDPFNNRYLLELLLSVDEKYRTYENRLFKMIISEMSPDLTKFPFNPLKGKHKLRRIVIILLRKIGLYEFFYKCYKDIKKKLNK